MARVFVRWSKWITVLALVLVIGGHWALLQSAAWVGMAVNFSKHDSVGVALQKTFNGKNPCPLCKLVKSGKAAEKKQDQQKLEAKIDFHFLAGTCGLFPPKPFQHFTPVTMRALARSDAPLLPPPRRA